MPKAQQHTAQAKSNELLAQKMCDGDSHYDWAVTISFYAALHYFEAFLVQKGINVLQEAEVNGKGAHNVRRKKAKQLLPEDEAEKYIWLQQQSERARYFASGNQALPDIPARYFSQGIAQEAFVKLQTFRNYLVGQI
ncbi:HEPN domain-containing protein [Calidithermus terrae]|uniref:HEPN domain-containing protein n=1 Tax=Calidithermus terrae TaxID=1408545 RepID=UPI000E65959C|nr:HEPN domain-containing protein [Calidithermus terrae]